MQTLNLANADKSDIKWSISRFPDGEVQITLEEFSRKDSIDVQCRITNAEELFILCQVNDILTRHAVTWNLEIYYLMSMRMDRVMDFNRPFSLSIVANILKTFSYSHLFIYEPHSNQTCKLLDSNDLEGITYFMRYLEMGEREFYQRLTLILPDAGAAKRYSAELQYFKPDTVICKKNRDTATGKLLGFEVTNPEVVSHSVKPFMVIDDLCDGGGTFCGIAAEIRKIKPDAELNIFITHMVNPKGIENLSKNFDHVYFTNTYKDWRGFKAEYGKAVPILPENVTQIDII